MSPTARQVAYSGVHRTSGSGPGGSAARHTLGSEKITYALQNKRYAAETAIQRRVHPRCNFMVLPLNSLTRINDLVQRNQRDLGSLLYLTVYFGVGPHGRRSC